MGSTNSTEAGPGLPKPEDPLCHPVMVPAYFSPFFQLSYPVWPAGYSGGGGGGAVATEPHEIVKPTAVHSKAPINVEELVGISKLTLGDAAPSPLSLKLAGGPDRQSAFHANSSAAAAAAAGAGSSDVGSSASPNPIHAL